MSAEPKSVAEGSAKAPVWLADLSLLSVAIIWGVNVPIMKVALLKMDRFALNGLRLVISAGVLLIFAWLEYRKGIRPQLRKNWKRILGYAVLVSVLYQLLFLLAVSQTTSADIALIMATVPMWTAIGARIFLKEYLPWLAWVGLFIAFAGTTIVTLQGKGSPASRPSTVVSEDREAAENVEAATAQTPGIATSAGSIKESDDVATSASPTKANAATEQRRFLGNLIALVAALTWSGGTIFSRPVLKSISPMQLSAFSATLGLPFHLAIAWPTIPASLVLLKQVPMDLCLLYSGVLSTGLALPMWSFGVKNAGAAHATMFQNLSPIFAIVTAWLWLSEPLNAAQITGGVLILGGLLVMRWSR
ncbi:MAG: DMT family transporter [Planctomycetaceae bacterium]